MLKLMDDRYRERREDLERRFKLRTLVEGTEKTHISPSGKFGLTISEYAPTPPGWNYTRGVVKDLRTQTVIADIKRNIGSFWHTFVEHPNGNEYLLFGEDYQGYSVLNLTTQRMNVYFPSAGHGAGAGFCWTEVIPSPDCLVLAVDGCYWACPYELVLFDFREPEKLPLPELCRVGELCETKGWQDNETFLLTREVEYRVSDGVLCENLTLAEQDEMENHPVQTDYKAVDVVLKRPNFSSPG